MTRSPTNTSKYLVLSLSLLIAFCSSSFGASIGKIGLQTFTTHTRLVVKVDESVPVELKNSAQGFQVLFKGISAVDLGAPYGEERDWLDQFKTLSDSRVGGISVQDTEAGLKVTGHWKYPTGKKALAHPEMEYFEYRDPAPQYVLDLWVKKGPTLAEVEEARIKAAQAAAAKEAEREASRRAARKLASEKLRAESEGITEKFCHEPLSEQTDVFLQFLPAHERVDFGRWLSAKVPDSNFTYFVPSAKTREAQYVRLALDLNRQGKSALVIRTLDFFENEHPDSSLRYEMRFLKASAMIKLGLNKEAEELLTKLMIDAKESPVALHSAMYLAVNQFQKQQWLASLESFLWLMQRYPEHRHVWVFHLGAGEALFALKQTERAAKEYQWVVENAPESRAKAEAALRIGDLYMDRLQYEQSLAAYFQGLTGFKEQAQSFPVIFINRGEVLYQLGQYERAKEAFEDFLKRFGAHPAGWRATFRLGEIAGRDRTQMQASRKWFYDTINRYPVSPGATLARLRLIPCADQGGFTLGSMAEFMKKEAQNFDGNSEVLMKRYELMKGLAHVRALISFDREDLAVTLALDELKRAGAKGSEQAKPYLNRIISALFRKSILKFLAEGRKYDAIAFYQEKKDLLSRDTPIGEMDFLLKLSQAASDLGLGALGKDLADSYAKAVAVSAGRSVAAAGGENDLDLQVSQAEQLFSRAKALWVAAVSSGDFAAKAEIRDLLSKVRQESHYSFDREVILGLLEEREGSLTGALRHAAQAQLLRPESASIEQDLRIEWWVASLQLKAGDAKIALEMLQGIEKRLASVKADNRKPASDSLGSLGVPALPGNDKVVLAQADIFEKLARWGEASNAYSRAVANGWGGNQAHFGLAKALIRTGETENLEKGKAELRKLASSAKDDFWRKLATEMLENEKFHITAKEGVK